MRRYLALEKIRIVAEDLQGAHPRKVAFMPRSGQVMVKKLKTAHDPIVVEREQALVQRTPEERAERLAKARARVELFQSNASANLTPRAELFSTNAAAARRPRVELFTSRLKTAEEA